MRGVFRGGDPLVHRRAAQPVLIPVDLRFGLQAHVTTEALSTTERTDFLFSAFSGAQCVSG
jgi:hypothetical protein